jgi:hypothetical protein
MYKNAEVFNGNYLTPQSLAHPEKLTGPQPLKQSPASYGT